MNWKRARAIFDSVVELAPAERRARLALMCGDDLALRQEVESLLSHDQTPRDVVEQLVAEAARAVTETHDPLRSGQTLLHYGLTAKIGQGGMGVVWKASDFTLGREVAIKVLPADVAHDPVRLARFEREAKLLAALNHPNIAGIYSLHEDTGVRFLAMEFVAGDDLSVRLARGPVTLAEVLQVTRQIAEALEEAHEKGIVHRDLKPGNVKVKADGTVKVLDFGLAKALADEAPGPATTDTSGAPVAADMTTRAGVILGTAAYMPPEQARGLAVDKRADIWAFGVLLFEMLSGTRPFAGATLTDVLAAVVTAEPDWTRLPAGTPAALVQLTRRCLQKDARQRLRDIGEARIDIARLLSGSGAGPAGPPFSLAVASGSPAHRRWRAAAVLLLVGGMTSAAVWQATRPAPAAPRRQRLNLAMPVDHRLEDILESTRQALTLSRDGGTVAFVARGPGGRRQIFQRRLDSVTPEPVTGTEGGDMPFLSPDGLWLGFAADGSLHKVPIGGGQAIVLCDAPEPRGASWGDDGTIVFAAGVRGGLTRVSSAGGAVVAVTVPDPSVEAESHRWPHLLPGSQAVVFNVERSGDNTTRRIDLARLDTGERRAIVTGGTDARYLDGSLVYGQAGTLVAAPFDLAQLRVTGPGVAVLDDVRMDMRSTGKVFADLSPTGTLVYVPGFVRPGVRSLVWLDRAGRATPATPDTRAFRGARVSPDGHSVAVTVQDAGNSLWLWDLRRGSWNRLTLTGDADTPTWTADSRQIVFSWDAQGPPAIYAVPADGSSRPARLSPPSSLLIDMPTVTPDGRTAIVAVQDANSDDLYTLSLDPRQQLAPLVQTPASETSPAISPSGRFMAYASTESGRREVYVQRFPGIGRRWVVSTSGGGTPRWRRDERELFYLDGARMMAVPVDPTGDLTIGTPRALFEEPALAWSNADLARYDVTGDGQRFLVVRPEPREIAPLQIVVVPHFGEELPARLRTR